MPTLDDIRQQYPQYHDLSDDKLAHALHDKFYADMPFDQFSNKIGFRAKSPGFLETALQGAESQFPVAQLFRQFPETSKAAVTGALIDLPGDVLDTMSGKTARELTSYIARGKPQREEIFSPSTAQRVQEGLGLQEGENVGELEHLALSGVRSAANPTNYLGGGAFLPKVVGGFASGALGEAAGDITHELAPESRLAESAARIAGAYVGGHATGASQRRTAIKEGESRLREDEELHDRAQQGYAIIEASPVSITPQGKVDANLAAQTAIHAENLTKAVAPTTFRILDQGFRSGRAMNLSDRTNRINAEIARIDGNLATLRGVRTRAAQQAVRDLQQRRANLVAARNNPYAHAALSMKISDILRIYQQLGKVVPGGHIGGGDALAAAHARGALRDWLEDPNNTPPGTGATIHQAIRDWAAYAKIDEVKRLEEIGIHRAEVSGSGYNVENTIRQEFRRLFDSDKRLRGFSDEARLQIERIFTDTRLRHYIRQLGRQNWLTSPESALVTSLWSAPLGTTLYLGSRAFNKLGQILTRKEISRLITILQEEAPSNQSQAARNRAIRRDYGWGAPGLSNRRPPNMLAPLSPGAPRRPVPGRHMSQPVFTGLRGATTMAERPDVQEGLGGYPLEGGPPEQAENGPGFLGDVANFAQGGLYGVAKGRGYHGGPIGDTMAEVAQGLGQGAVWAGPKIAQLKRAIEAAKVSGGGWTEVMKSFPNDNRKAVQMQAARIGLVQPFQARWTPEAIAYLKANIGKSAKELARELNAMGYNFSENGVKQARWRLPGEPIETLDNPSGFDLD